MNTFTKMNPLNIDKIYKLDMDQLYEYFEIVDIYKSLTNADDYLIEKVKTIKLKSSPNITDIIASTETFISDGETFSKQFVKPVEPEEPDEQLCPICFEPDINNDFMILNCHDSHRVCILCYSKIDKCMMCRTPIENAIEPPILNVISPILPPILNDILPILPPVVIVDPPTYIRPSRIFKTHRAFYVITRETNHTIFLQPIIPTRTFTSDENVLWHTYAGTIYTSYDLDKLELGDGVESVLKRLFTRRFTELTSDEINNLDNVYFKNHVNKHSRNDGNLFCIYPGDYHIMRVAFALQSRICSLTNTALARDLERPTSNYYNSAKKIYNEYYHELNILCHGYADDIRLNRRSILITLGRFNNFDKIEELLLKGPIL
jgi:hypothetical protein